jgi:hypothetical protein
MFAIDAQRDGKRFIVRANDRDACLVIGARRARKLQLSGRSFFWLFLLTPHLNFCQNALGVRA